MASGGTCKDTATLVHNNTEAPIQEPPPRYGFTGRQTGSHSTNGFFNPASVNQHTIQMNTISSMDRAGQVAIPQPMDDGIPPETSCSLVMSTLSALFCFLWCGLMAIGVSWQARLQVLDRKFSHARHSLSIVKILICISLFFGLIYWGLMIWYLSLVGHWL